MGLAWGWGAGGEGRKGVEVGMGLRWVAVGWDGT